MGEHHAAAPGQRQRRCSYHNRRLRRRNKLCSRIAANGKVNDALYLYNQEYWEICNLDISNTVDGCKMVAGDTNPTGNVTARDNSG